METKAEINRALRLAAAQGKEIELLRKLWEGANVNDKGHGDKYGNALQAASANGHNHVVEILLRSCATVNISGGKYGYPLVAASNKGHLEIVQRLVDTQANIRASHPSYGTALHAALRRGHNEIVKLLLEKGAVADGSAVQIAAAAGNRYAVKLLLKEAADLGNVAIKCAAEHGNDNMVRSILRKINHTKTKMTWYGPALVAASANGHDNMVALLLDKRDHLGDQVKDEWHRDAFAQALKQGHLRVISQFLGRNDLVCSLEGTPLHSLDKDLLPALSLLLRINRVER